MFPKKYKTEDDKSYEKLLLELNLQTLEERRNILCLQFAKDCIKFDKLKDLFPENTKKHTMEIRDKEKYKVLHANLDRLKDSSIIHMQNLLNTEYKQNKQM